MVVVVLLDLGVGNNDGGILLISVREHNEFYIIGNVVFLYVLANLEGSGNTCACEQ